MEKRKAIIVTWCLTSLNYGELFQAYAMQSILKKFQIEPVTVSFLDAATRRSLKKNTIYKENFIWHHKFRHFISRYMGAVIQCRDREEVERVSVGSDIYICGSDQIWNPGYYSNNSVYTLKFGKKDAKRIAYAPSIGLSRLLSSYEKRMDIMAADIQKIDYISVRENTARDILEARIHRDIQVVLDPTLLISRKEWRRISSKRKIRKKYILVYILGETDIYEGIINQAADKYQADSILWLDMTKGKKLKGKKVQRIRMASPEDFLNYINMSCAVVTDSFHGLMFSIKFKKPFYILRRKYERKYLGDDPRLDDILDRLDIKERIVRCGKDIEKMEPEINYQKINSRINEEKKKSIEFLKAALSEEKG